TGDGCRFYTSEQVGAEVCSLLICFAHDLAGVQLVEMLLKAHLGIFRHADKFDSHADSRIASSYDCARGKTLFAYPKVYTERSGNWQGHDRLNITAISADVCGIDAQWGVDAFVAKLEWVRNLVTEKLAAIVVADLGAFFLGGIRWKRRQPGTFLIGYQL